MVKLQHSSTMVLAAPIEHVELLAAGDEGVGVHHPVVDVHREEPAEEHHFLAQEEPHAQEGRLLLLRIGLEVMGQARLVGNGF